MKVNINTTFDPFLFRLLREIHGVTSDSQFLLPTTEPAVSQPNFEENIEKNKDC